jgi:hypothetical protein
LNGVLDTTGAVDPALLAAGGGTGDELPQALSTANTAKGNSLAGTRFGAAGSFKDFLRKMRQMSA